MIAGVGYCALFGVGWVVIADFKTWLFARSDEGKNIKNTCKKAWKIVSHNMITNCKTFINF
jgi:hypothetical protein